MATDEMIWGDIGNNFCTVEDDNGKEILRCNHYVGTRGKRVCSAQNVGPHEYPCGNRPRILVNKREYITWKLTR